MPKSQKHIEAARETMRRNATKHGLASGDTKPTYYLCKSILAHDPMDPAESQVAPEWWDLEVFVRAVIAEIGPRPCKHYLLGPRRDHSHLLDPDAEPIPMKLRPGFIEWLLPPPERRRKGLAPHPDLVWRVLIDDQRMELDPKDGPRCPEDGS